jgi:Di-haem oxidoreductase, putative peroxidase
VSYFHHGLFTTLAEAVLAHSGEARAERLAFEQSSVPERESLLAFLQSLQVLPIGTPTLSVDEQYRAREW